MREDLKPIPNTRLYFIDSAKSLLAIRINGLVDTFLFDLGASANVVSERPSTVDPKYTRTNTAKGINGTKYITELIALDSLSSPIFSWIGAPVLYSATKPYRPCGRKAISQILGAGIIKATQPLYINYKEGYLSYVDSTFDKTGYTSINAQFSAKGVFRIGLLVNGKELQFLFDPGNNDANYIREEEISALQLKDGVRYEKYSLDFKNTLITSTGQAFKDVPLTIGNLSPVLERFVSTSGIQMNNFGLKSIQKYNWLMDAANKKVYAQPNTVGKPADAKSRTMAYQLPMIAPDGYLIVGGVLVGKSRFALGDRIVSVQNKAVTANNTCAMFDILGRSANWDTLQVVTQKTVH